MLFSKYFGRLTSELISNNYNVLYLFFRIKILNKKVNLIKGKSGIVTVRNLAKIK